MAREPRRIIGTAKLSALETLSSALAKVRSLEKIEQSIYFILTKHHDTGGWNRETDKVERELVLQIQKAFENVEHTLKTAGCERGWDNVFFVRSYHLPLNDEAMETMVDCLKHYCPNHQPAWTAVGVPRLAFDDMRVEIEVRAHIPSDKKD